MNVLLVGSGAREHAIAKILCAQTSAMQLNCFAATHNPGIKKLAANFLVGNINNVHEVVEFARQHPVEFAIIGPEAPLEHGLADALWRLGVPVIGPKQKLAQIETSKSFARDLMKKYQIPGAPRYQVFQDIKGVEEFLRDLGEEGYVIKANGLMGGKGVKVAGEHLHSFDEALDFCRQVQASNQIFVIEEKLIGQEFSLMGFCDGKQVFIMPCVQDHKRAFQGDRGPNTGGMGSYSDANHLLPFLSAQDVEAARQINQQVMLALQNEFDEKYIGILYGSFIATRNGIAVIEFNARFGDPEAMNVLSILESNFADLCRAMINNSLTTNLVRFAPMATVCKYVVPEGYPDNGLKNAALDISAVKNPSQLYLASVNEQEGQLFTAGSRAVAVVGVAKTITEAEVLAEAEVMRIRGRVFHREDIGTSALIQQRIEQMRMLRAGSEL